MRCIPYLVYGFALASDEYEVIYSLVINGLLIVSCPKKLKYIPLSIEVNDGRVCIKINEILDIVRSVVLRHLVIQ